MSEMQMVLQSMPNDQETSDWTKTETKKTETGRSRGGVREKEAGVGGGGEKETCGK